MTPEDTKYWLGQGEPRTDALAQIAGLLSTMFVSSRAHVRGPDEEVVGYTVQNGALHKIVGILAGLGHRVIIPANLPTAHEHISGVLLSTKKADERGSAEPAGWYDTESGVVDWGVSKPMRKPHSPSAEWRPIYTAPARDGSEPGLREALKRLAEVYDAMGNPRGPAIIAAEAALAATPEQRAEPDMRAVCEALGFDPTNHHNADKCPYCRGQRAEPQGLTDAERLDWLVGKLFVSAWNGVVGSGARTHWRIAPDYRHTMQHFIGETLREAIDAARASAGREKP